MSQEIKSIISEATRRRNNDLVKYDKIYNEGNYCSMKHFPKRKLSNSEKARSLNVGLIKPICSECAFELAHLYYGMFGFPDEWRHKRFRTDKPFNYEKIVSSIDKCTSAEFTSKDIAESSKIAFITTASRISELVKAGFLSVRKVGRQSFYSKSEKWKLEDSVKALVFSSRAGSVKRILKRIENQNGLQLHKPLIDSRIK